MSAGWLTRLRRLGRGNRDSDRAPPPPVVRTAPGLAALFESLDPAKSHPVLDLGAAAEASLSVYSRLARQVRFADQSSVGPSEPLPWMAALDEAANAAVEPYDVLLIWDTLGRVPPDERPLMVARLAKIAAPGSRLHMVMEAPERTGPRPVRFSLFDPGRMRHELTWDGGGPTSRLFPSDVERMLAPFQVDRAFTLKDGLREYLAVLRPRRPGSNAPQTSHAREILPPSGAHGGLRPSETDMERALRRPPGKTLPPPEKI